ncbi:hypothetical protein [Streptomyces sp. NPDC001153]
MSRRLMLGICGGLLMMGTAACGGGDTPKAASAPQASAAAVASPAHECTKRVLAAVSDKLWADSGKVRNNTERNQRGRDFVVAYGDKPEMQIFLHAGSDAVIAINGDKTVTQAIAGTVNRITTECADAYPE